MTLSRNRIERRNGINDEEPTDLRSSTWRTKHIGLEGIRGLTRLLCIFPGYLTVPFFAQVYMVTSKLSVNYLKFSFKSILIKCTIRLRPKIALLRLWVYGGRGDVSLLLCPWVRPSVRPSILTHANVVTVTRLRKWLKANFQVAFMTHSFFLLLLSTP